MATFAIGDVQGCDRELETLLEALDFSRSRDRLWFVGDLVNRGPDSLAVLRRVRALGDAAVVVLGNHDLHLLAVAFGAGRLRSDDTLDALLAAPDRSALLDWLLHRPLLHQDTTLGACLLHAGLAPQWTLDTALQCARDVEQALSRHPEHVFRHMYGDLPDRWDPAFDDDERRRFTVNCLTRLRFVDAQDRLALRVKGAPGKGRARDLTPWFEAPQARWRGRARLVFGHWSTLGYFDDGEVVGLDTGCVWGGSLTGLALDVGGAKPLSVPCSQAQAPGGE